MKFEHLLLETKERVAILTINRPSALNALSDALLTEIDAALGIIEADQNIKGVIITGTGKAFVAGADISQMVNYTPEQARSYMKRAQATFNRIESIEKPFLAAVNGYALGGGCELSLACDLRFASEKAIFGQPEVNLGVMPGFGGSQRLPRLICTAIAKDIIYSGRNVKADEALRVGLVNRVCEPEKLIDEALEYMNIVVSKSATALRGCKVAINRGMEIDIYSALELEADLMALCFAGPDQKEGMQAFLEKRPAKFKN